MAKTKIAGVAGTHFRVKSPVVKSPIIAWCERNPKRNYLEVVPCENDNEFRWHRPLTADGKGVARGNTEPDFWRAMAGALLRFSMSALDDHRYDKTKAGSIPYREVPKLFIELLDAWWVPPPAPPAKEPTDEGLIIGDRATEQIITIKLDVSVHLADIHHA